jgi:hypothetical protein
MWFLFLGNWFPLVSFSCMDWILVKIVTGWMTILGHYTLAAILMAVVHG